MSREGTVRARGLLPGFANSADLGGLPLPGGLRTQPRRVVRADTPERLSPAELAVTTSFSLTAVLDLRSEDELRVHPHPLAATAGYQSLPLIDPVAEARVDVYRLAGLGAVYSSSLRRNARNIAAIFRALASTSTGPVMVSCRAGRDRTGMVVALLLDLVGVPRDLVVEDYVQVSATTDHAVPNGADILQMLEHVTTRYGSTSGYLRWLGLPEEDVTALRRRLLP